MFRKQLILGESQLANEQALQYLEEKYGEKFTYAAPYRSEMSGRREFLVTCDSLPGQQVWVYVEDYYEKDKVFRDNYLAVKYEQQTIDFLKEQVAAKYPSVNVFYEARKKGVSDRLSADTGFSEYLLENGVELIVMLELKASEFGSTEPMDQIVENIAQACKEMALTVVVTEDDVYGTMDLDGLNDAISLKHYVQRGKIYIRGGEIQTDWQGGIHE